MILVMQAADRLRWGGGGSVIPKKTAMAPISPLRMLESKEVAFDVGLFSKALLK